MKTDDIKSAWQPSAGVCFQMIRNDRTPPKMSLTSQEMRAYNRGWFCNPICRDRILIQGLPWCYQVPSARHFRSERFYRAWSQGSFRILQEVLKHSLEVQTYYSDWARTFAFQLSSTMHLPALPFINGYSCFSLQTSSEPFLNVLEGY